MIKYLGTHTLIFFCVFLDVVNHAENNGKSKFGGQI